MRTRTLAACVGMAMAIPAAGQAQQFIMVARGPSFTPTGDPRAIMLFSPQDGTLIDPDFIPGIAAQYQMDFPKDVMQVGQEVWVSDQTEDLILRFDLIGNYVGVVRENMDNIRGMEVHDGVVYVTNATAAGGSPGNSLVKFDAAGTFLGAFSVGTSPFDALFFNGQMLVSHSSGPDDITAWGLDGTPLGVFHTGAITLVSQLHRRASTGNLLAAGSSNPAGLYEYDSGGTQVAVHSGLGVRAGIELFNGKFLVTNANGVHIHDPATGTTTMVTNFPGHYMNLLTTNPGATGACCLPSGLCEILSLGNCASQGGIFRGAGTTCATAACPQPGACWLPSGLCALLQPQPCADQGGIWYGPGAPCTVNLDVLRVTSPPTSNFIAFNGSGVFLDLTAAAEDLEVPRVDLFPVAGNGGPVTVDVYTRPGSYVGFTGSPAGWTLTQTVQAVSIGGTANPTRLMLTSPIVLPQGQTVGVYLVGTAGGVRYRSAATTVNNADLSLFSNTVASLPFGGTISTPRGFTGAVFYTPVDQCYPDCNGDGQLNLADFGCFQTKFALGDPYADCNGDGSLNLADFGCFQTKFALGCP